MGFDLEDRKKVNSSRGGRGVIDTWNNYSRKGESTSCNQATYSGEQCNPENKEHETTGQVAWL